VYRILVGKLERKRSLLRFLRIILKIFRRNKEIISKLD
jgi:hypothetical protein